MWIVYWGDCRSYIRLIALGKIQHRRHHRNSSIHNNCLFTAMFYFIGQSIVSDFDLWADACPTNSGPVEKTISSSECDFRNRESSGRPDGGLPARVKGRVVRGRYTYTNTYMNSCAMLHMHARAQRRMLEFTDIQLWHDRSDNYSCITAKYKRRLPLTLHCQSYYKSNNNFEEKYLLLKNFL